MRSFKEDYKNGVKAEETIKEILEKKWGKLNKLHSRHEMDYEGEDCFIEIKTRTNTYNKYPTTLMPFNKFVYVTKTFKKVIFVFNFSDGIYWVDTKDLLEGENFKYKKFCRRRRTDFNDKPSKYLLIDIDCLTLLN